MDIINFFGGGNMLDNWMKQGLLALVLLSGTVAFAYPSAGTGLVSATIDMKEHPQLTPAWKYWYTLDPAEKPSHANEFYQGLRGGDKTAVQQQAQQDFATAWDKLSPDQKIQTLNHVASNRFYARG